MDQTKIIENIFGDILRFKTIYAILTVYEVAAGSKTIFVDNIFVDRSLQIGVKVGKPSPI